MVTLTTIISCHMNLLLPIRFEVQLTRARWTLVQAIPEHWNKISTRIVLTVRVPNTEGKGGKDTHANFPLEHLSAHWSSRLDQLSGPKREELDKGGTGVRLENRQVEPLDVLRCHPLRRSTDVEEVEPGKLRDEFFSLRETHDLLDFLNRFGMWRPHYSPFGGGWSPAYIFGTLRNSIDPMKAESIKQRDLVVTPEAIWHDRSLLQKRMLVASKAPEVWFAKSREILLLEPVTTNPFYRHTARCAGDAIEASIAFDLLQGTKFSLCRRRDCAKPFVANRRGKLFCCYDCAHLVAVRNSRKPTALKTKGSVRRVDL